MGSFGIFYVTGFNVLTCEWESDSTYWTLDIHWHSTERSLASCDGHGMHALQSSRWTQEPLVRHLGIADKCTLCPSGTPFASTVSDGSGPGWDRPIQLRREVLQFLSRSSCFSFSVLVLVCCAHVAWAYVPGMCFSALAASARAKCPSRHRVENL